MAEVDISAVALVARHARIHPALDAVVYEGEHITYAALHTRVARLAAAFAADDVGPGDRVAYAGHNSVTLLETYLAAIWVGAAFLPVNFRLAAPEVRDVLRDAQVDLVVAEPVHAALIDSERQTLDVRRRVVVDDDPGAGASTSLADRWESLSALRASDAPDIAPVPRHEGDLAALLYTSGTTGRAKGVMLTHGNLWWNAVNVDAVVDTRFGDVCYAAAPLFHIGGFNALLLRTLTRGGTLVIRRAFQPAQALEDLQQHRVTGMFLVPAMLAAIARQEGFSEADLTALRATIAAGAPVPPALIEVYAAKGVLVQQAWGLTETAPFATYLEAAHTVDKLGSCGVGMPYTSVRVVDPATLRDVADAGATGELWVRGPNVSTGYWNNPEATAAAFTPDGWFRTGDIGFADEEGYLFIVDRLKDMVISGGENVYPAEIENILNGHPAVDDVAVIGVPDEKWGEAVCAIVAVRDGTEVTLEHLRDFLTGKIARYKLPSRLVIVDSVPRNGAGKLDKPLLRRLYGDGVAARVHTVDSAPFTEAVATGRRRG